MIEKEKKVQSGKIHSGKLHAGRTKRKRFGFFSDIITIDCLGMPLTTIFLCFSPFLSELYTHCSRWTTMRFSKSREPLLSSSSKRSKKFIILERTQIAYQAYRALVLQWHPDKNKSDGASDMFRIIKEASEVRSCRKKKEKKKENRSRREERKKKRREK